MSEATTTSILSTVRLKILLIGEKSDLSAAVDVYAAWIDAADAVNKGDHEDDEPHLVHGAHPARGSKANGDEQDGYAEPDAENFIDDKEDPGRLDFEDDE